MSSYRILQQTVTLIIFFLMVSCQGNGLGNLPEGTLDELTTLEDRDYVRHWFRSEADAEEDAFIAALALSEVPVQGA